jgi:hypothetical protein
MDDQPKIPLELQRRIEKRWEARFSQAQRLNDASKCRVVPKGRRHVHPSPRTTRVQHENGRQAVTLVHAEALASLNTCMQASHYFREFVRPIERSISFLSISIRPPSRWNVRPSQCRAARCAQGLRRRSESAPACLPLDLHELASPSATGRRRAYRTER